MIGDTSSASIVASSEEEDGLLLQLDALSGEVVSVTSLDTSTDTLTNRDALRHSGTDANGRLYVVGGVTGDTLGTLAGRFTLNPCPADLAPPFEVLDRADIRAFINAFRAQDPFADIDGNGRVDSADAQTYIDEFRSGCPTDGP